MKLVDTHAHLDSFALNGTLDDVLREAETAGLERIITASAKPEDWLLYAKMAEDHAGFVSWQIGIHPEDIDENSDIALDALATFFAAKTPPVAIGEIGLDYHFLPADSSAEKIAARQKEIFRRQLLLAKDMQTKVCIHARDAVDDAIAVMREADFDFSNAVFHCYAGNEAQLELLNALGARASWTGVITYKSAEQMRRCMLRQGLGKIMFETDCPYLAPVPLRGRQNRPAFVRHTVEFAAALFGLPAEELAELSTRNATQFFYDS